MSDQPVLSSSTLEAERGEISQAEAFPRPEPAAGLNGTAHPASLGARPAAPPLSPLNEGGGALDMLMNVSLQLTVELGRTRMTVRQVIDLQKGSVVELNRIAGDPVDVFVNDRLIARGEVVVVDDKFGVRVTEIISPNGDGSEN